MNINVMICSRLFHNSLMIVCNTLWRFVDRPLYILPLISKQSCLLYLILICICFCLSTICMCIVEIYVTVLCLLKFTLLCFVCWHLRYCALFVAIAWYLALHLHYAHMPINNEIDISDLIDWYNKSKWNKWVWNDMHDK